MAAKNRGKGPTVPGFVLVEKLQLELRDALVRFDFLNVLYMTANTNVVEAMCRSSDDKRLAYLIRGLLSKEEAWTSFLGKRFVLKDGKLRYGWVFRFESTELPSTVSRLRVVLADIFDEMNRDMSPQEPVGVSVPAPILYQGSPTPPVEEPLSGLDLILQRLPASVKPYTAAPGHEFGRGGE